MPETLQILHYEYVPDMVSKREPHRDAHIDLIKRWHGDDRLVIAGAVGDPPHGAVFVWTEREGIDEWVDADPYVKAGLVTDWRVEPWNVVVR